ncbi:MAG: hypothetical protein FJ333_04495, partial [Sphingomonadales bacterium]|nr:hypothetical protein [Sphingomonadales bacterium]
MEKKFGKPKFTEKKGKRTEMNGFCKKLYCLEKKNFDKPKFTEKNGKRLDMNGYCKNCSVWRKKILLSQNLLKRTEKERKKNKKERKRTEKTGKKCEGQQNKNYLHCYTV